MARAITVKGQANRTRPTDETMISNARLRKLSMLLSLQGSYTTLSGCFVDALLPHPHTDVSWWHKANGQTNRRLLRDDLFVYRKGKTCKGRVSQERSDDVL